MRGRTTIVITHSPTLAAEADRVIEFAQGRIVGEVDPREAGERVLESVVAE
jgi:ABC-type multidrug transport system fused ATPase/permease subunit